MNVVDTKCLGVTLNKIKFSFLPHIKKLQAKGFKFVERSI